MTHEEIIHKIVVHCYDLNDSRFQKPGSPVGYRMKELSRTTYCAREFMRLESSYFDEILQEVQKESEKGHYVTVEATTENNERGYKFDIVVASISPSGVASKEFKADLEALLVCVDFDINDTAEDAYKAFFNKYPELKPAKVYPGWDAPTQDV